MKTISLAFLLAMASCDTLGKGDSALRVNMSARAETSENIGTASPQAAGIASAKQASIRELLELEGSNPCLHPPLVELEEGGVLTKDLQPDQKRLVTLFFARFKEKMRNDEINIAVNVYDKHFSQAEIDGLASLYKTPLARKELPLRYQVLVEINSRKPELLKQWLDEATTEILNENPDLRKAMEADPNWKPKR